MATTELKAGLIPYDLLLLLHQIFLARKHQILSEDLPSTAHMPVDTKSILFKIDRTNPQDPVLNFLREIINDNEVDGLRIYLCAYPHAQMMYPISSGTTINIPHKIEYVSKTTLCLVGTAKIDNTDHQDIYDKVFFAPPPLNHGTLCPPDDCQR
jgi:hypothetical protein